MGKVRKTVDVHESTIINANAIMKQVQAELKAHHEDFERQMAAFTKALTPNDRKLNRKYSKVTSVTLHPLILAFIKEHKLTCNDFIVEGPESIRLKEKLDV